MFRRPANKLSISGRVKRAARERARERQSLACRSRMYFSDRVIFV